MSTIQKILATLAVIIIFMSMIFIYSILQNEKPAFGTPRVPFVDGEFMLNDLEEITAPVIDDVSEDNDIVKTGGDRNDVVLDDEKDSEVPVLISDVEVLVENLTIPWGLDFLPNGHLIISERGGNVIDFNYETGEHMILEIEGVRHSGEGGLLGLTLHPNYEENNYVYVYRTSSQNGKSINSVLRYTYQHGRLEDERIIVEGIPGAHFHNGGRIAFGPDNLLYITTGDAQNPEFSQDLSSLAGKILRVTDGGGIPPENPFNTIVYTYGHRNPQGLTWDEEGALWSTEHGRSGLHSGFDELNLIIPGGNYGWPDSQGPTVFTDTVGPTIHSGSTVTWAPGSAAYLSGSVFFGGLKGESLYQAELNGVDFVSLEAHFPNEYGRIRTVVVGPDNLLYITTSNRDGRGDVRVGDDKIIRLNPAQFEEEIITDSSEI